MNTNACKWLDTLFFNMLFQCQIPKRGGVLYKTEGEKEEEFPFLFLVFLYIYFRQPNILFFIFFWNEDSMSLLSVQSHCAYTAVLFASFHFG